MNFLEINRICPLTMLLKCTKFVKHTCDSFLKIFLKMLKWTHINTHTNTHLHGSDAISQQVVRGDNLNLDSVSYSTVTNCGEMRTRISSYIPCLSEGEA